jgi:predicted  nucleic acid-binding Zn-ribbon protein
MGAAEAAIGTKAAQADHEALAGRVTTAEGKITTLEGEMDTVEGKVATLEGYVGDKKVSDAISEAITGLKNNELTTMQGEIDAVEGRADALEAKAHEHANKEELDRFVTGDKAKLDSAVQNISVTTGDCLYAIKNDETNVVQIGFKTEGTTWIFDCGNSEA